MSGSVPTTGGLPPTTAPTRLGFRLGAAGLALLALLALILGVKAHTARRLAELQRNFATLETEAFNLALYVRTGIHELNGIVLRSQLTGGTNDREDFGLVAKALLDRIRLTLPKLSTAAEQKMAADLQVACEGYLQATSPLIDVNLRPLKRESIGVAFDTVRARAAAVMTLAEEFAALQRSALADQFKASYEAVGSMRRVTRINTLLLLLLLGGIGILGYRLVVAPLRRQLSASQAAMADQQKLASLGVLAAGVAHEIRNPLTAIKLRLFSFGRELPPTVAGHEDLKVIAGEVDRLERIVQGFLDYARPAEPRMQRLSAREVLDELAELLRGTLKKQGIELAVEQAEECIFTADKEQVKQVLINLTRNAGESMEAGGTVRLRARAAVAKMGNKTGPVVTFEVSDTGKGIAPEKEDQVFEPFYSSKTGGTGLGLAIAARIAERHNGSLQFYSRVNQGTTFTLTLPRSS